MEKLEFRDALLTFVLVVIIAQAFSWLVSAIASVAGLAVPSINVGPVIMLLLLAVLVLAVWRVVFYWLKGAPITNADLVILLVIVGSVVLAYYFFPRLVPSLFENSMSAVRFAVQSVAGGVS